VKAKGRPERQLSIEPAQNSMDADVRALYETPLKIRRGRGIGLPFPYPRDPSMPGPEHNTDPHPRQVMQ